MATKWPIKEKAISYRNGLLTKTKQNIKKSKGTEQIKIWHIIGEKKTVEMVQICQMDDWRKATTIMCTTRQVYKEDPEKYGKSE